MTIPIEDVVVGGVYEGQRKSTFPRKVTSICGPGGCWVIYWRGIESKMSNMSRAEFAKWAIRRVDQGEEEGDEG